MDGQDKTDGIEPIIFWRLEEPEISCLRQRKAAEIREILQGARRLLARSHPVLVLALHGATQKIECFEILRSLGYRWRANGEDDRGPRRHAERNYRHTRCDNAIPGRLDPLQPTRSNRTCFRRHSCRSSPRFPYRRRAATDRCRRPRPVRGGA